jgi:hypothetical protein
MPVILIKAVMVDKAEVRDAYICPVYKTTSRGPTYVRACALASMPAVRAWVLPVRARAALGARSADLPSVVVAASGPTAVGGVLQVGLQRTDADQVRPVEVDPRGRRADHGRGVCLMRLPLAVPPPEGAVHGRVRMFYLLPSICSLSRIILQSMARRFKADESGDT